MHPLCEACCNLGCKMQGEEFMKEKRLYCIVSSESDEELEKHIPELLEEYK